VTTDGTASVLAARPALWALREKGVDAQGLLLSAGFSDAALESVENRLPYSRCVGSGRRLPGRAATTSSA